MSRLPMIPIILLTTGLVCIVCGFVSLNRWARTPEEEVSSDKPTKVEYTPAPPTEEGKIELLRNEAEKRGLKWKIISCYWDDPVTFLGEAVAKGQTFSSYIEEGGVPRWLESGKTQGDAAYNLYLSIHRVPNSFPEHKGDDKFSPERRLKAPPNIESEPESGGA